MKRKGIPTCNVTKEASILEKDKIFAQNLIKEIDPHLIPKNNIVTSYSKLIKITKNTPRNIVLLDQNEGSRIFIRKENISQVKKYFNRAKKGLLIENWINGNEYSIYCLTDGKNCIFSYPIINYPFRDKNSLIKTGGMGSVCSGEKTLTFLTKKDFEYSCSIIKEIIKKMNKRNIVYKGTLCGQFIITPSRDIYFIEFDVRAGDTEITNFLANLETSFLSLMLSIHAQDIKNQSLKMNKKKSITVAIVPPNYPFKKNEIVKYKIREDIIKKDGNELFFGKTYRRNNYFVTTKSRALAIMGKGETYEEIRKKVLNSANQFSSTLYFRRDIGVINNY